jgi:hypothetical protein
VLLIALLCVTSDPTRPGRGPTVLAQEPLRPAQVLGTIGGAVDAVVAAKGFAYAIAANTIVAVDATDPQSPRQTWRSPSLGADLRHLAIAEDHLYVTDHRSRLRAYDLVRPHRPRLRANVSAGGLSADLVIRDGLAYVLTEGTLEIFDLADPGQPRKIARRWLYEVEEDGGRRDLDVNVLQVADGVAYLANDLRPTLWTVDVSDPTADGGAQPFALPGAPAEIAEDLGTGGPPFLLVHEGHVLLVTSTTTGPPLHREDQSLHVIDARDPTQLRLVASVALPTAYIARYAALVADHVVLRSGRHWHLVDVAVPSEPGPMVTTPAAVGYDFAMDGSLAFVVAGGLRLVDLAYLAQPRDLGRVPTLGGTGRLAVTGRQAVIEIDGAPQRFDLSVAGCPRWHSAIEVAGDVQAIEAADGLAYLLSEDALHIVDVAAGASARLGSVGIPPREDRYPPSRLLALDGGRAYIGDMNGVRILDVRDPRRPRDLGYTATPLGVRALSAAGPRLAVVNHESKLHLWDVSDPAAPRPEPAASLIVPRSEVPALALLDGVVLYASAQELWIIDPNDAVRPRRTAALGLGEMSDFGWLRSGVDLVVEGSRAYIASAPVGFVVVDISDLDTPAILSTHAADLGVGYPNQVAYADGHAYLGSDPVVVVPVAAAPASVAPQPTPLAQQRPHLVWLPTVLRGWTQRCP